MPQGLESTLYTRTSETLSELQDTVRGDLGLRNATFLTDDDITRWLNRAQNILARDTRAFCIRLAIPTVSGTAEYVLPYNSSARAIGIGEVFWQNQPMWPVTGKQLSVYNYQWRSVAAGTPWGYYQCGGNAIGLYPAPNVSGTSDLVVLAAVLPPKVSAPDDYFYVPAGCDDVLISYAEYRASMKDAYGEGRDRIAPLREEWERGKAHAVQVVRAIRSKFLTSNGSDALLDRQWWWFRPNDLATPLP